ncbi:MAG TPA: patatin-like phospholipase family protein [Spirochaetales bacterium]|nr:patatin-like phospholipase family protein [Spirochaetales bacterium]
MKWALVLSGGGARGLAHIGLLAELERRGAPRPGLVAGTSMGAIVGALYACGWDGERMERYALGFDIKRYLENPAFRLPDFALSRVLQAGTALGVLAMKRGLDSGERVLAELERLFEGRRFEDLDTPFACMAVDLVSGRERVFDSGPLALAVRASMSFPGVFAPVAIDGGLYADGGIVDNLPVRAALARGYKRVLASDVSTFPPLEPERMKNGLSVLLRCYDVASEKAQGRPQDQASLYLPIEGPVPIFGFDQAADALAMGRKAVSDAAPRLDRFFRPGPFRGRPFLRTLFR